MKDSGNNPSLDLAPERPFSKCYVPVWPPERLGCVQQIVATLSPDKVEGCPQIYSDLWKE